MNNLLTSIYFNPKHSSSFGSVDSLYKIVKLKFPQITRKYVTDWLSQQYTYTLHRPLRKHFSRNRIYVSYIDENWEADLVDMQEFSRKNNGFKYILTVIDVLSKYLWVEPLKTKSAKNVVSAFKKIFNTSGRKPTKIRTDRGLEFENSEFKTLCKNNNIRFFTSQDKRIKCSIVERVNRTLKGRMFKYFTAYGTRKYIDVLDDLVEAYNNKIHRSIKMKPIDVTAITEYIAYNNLYKNDKLKQLNKPTDGISKQLTTGATVRKTYELNSFDKGYYPNWTDQNYKIVETIHKNQKPLYVIENFRGDREKRRFYPEELQKIHTNTEYRIEKIIRKRKTGNITQFLVKWIGYPDSENSWIPAKDILRLKNRKT